MGVIALDPDYASKVAPADTLDKFHGNQLVYIHWEEHLMFCAALAFPFPPGMPFGAILAEILPTFYGIHPDFEKIDWGKVRWTVDGKDITPDPEKSLADHGVGHKSLIRFWTPGLTGVNGLATV
ncbi:phenol hydroxylase subunit P4 [Ruegeria sp. PrR005]|uniref:Phenol hydroxylase n=1 Tax=Ruegeria sp. PrR005 TaxID=2706882 RepID=A0A6B2NLL2_9RHOB|nr:phenol hydroxylase subunit P4 [Ruegeria sp. PrR005]NDW43873.1 phenol hydroxylase [Ruegeria sp. PrR005]